MKIQPFKLERYFAKHEFSAPYLLCCSDCEPLPMKELLEMADEGIYIAMNILLKKGDHVITTFPGYQSLYEIANSIGCKVSRWKPRYKNGWFFDINDLESLIEEKTRLLVINFPHNPTGATISQNEIEKIIEIAERNNIFLFSDEMYRFLEYKPTDRTASACDLSEKAISLFGMSKSFALAGLRIGWLTTKNHKLFRQIAAFKDYTTICNSAPSEILAIMALKSKNIIIKRNLKLLGAFFEKYKQLFEWYKPKAGPIAFPKLKGDINVSEFCADLIEKEGVLLLPSDQYDFEGNNFRIGFARKNMPEALDKLEKHIKKNLI